VSSPADQVTVERRYLEQVAYAATAWAGLLRMRRALGKPLVPPGATVSIDGGPPQPLTEAAVDLELLVHSVREVRRLLGWRR
jgi:hypothetical protein